MMNSDLDNNTILNPSQIENLQNLIRTFKALSKRFADSNLPRLIESHAQQQQLHQQQQQQQHQQHQNIQIQHQQQEIKPEPNTQNNHSQDISQLIPQRPLHHHQQLPIQIPSQHPTKTQGPTQNHITETIDLNQETVVNEIDKNTANPQVSYQSNLSAPPSQVNNLNPNPQSTLTQSSSLSWQCFYSLLLFGSGKNVDGAISFPFSDIGCFSKGAHLPLVLTIPGMVSVKEEVLKSSLLYLTQKMRETGSMKLKSHEFFLQRHLRASLLKFLESKKKDQNELTLSQIYSGLPLGASNQLSELSNYSSFLRIRKQSKREIKAWDRDEKKKRLDYEDRKKKKNAEFLKVVMEHRESFFKAHKSAKAEVSKVARLVKSVVESNDLKRERDEAKSEMRRLQALKENDMEAYTSLVQETKNGRLKYLLSETDNYIATIKRMIQEQRNGGGSENSNSDLENNEGSNITKTTKDYYQSTHRTVEMVTQPHLLKGGDLKEYQLSGLQWLVSLYNNNLNGILADEMGLGKTIQTISLIAYLMEFKNNNGPFLIVVPLSTLSNWVNEFNKWAPDVVKVVYKGSPEERKKIYKDEIENGMMNVLLTTYEYIMRDKSSLKKIVWQYVIVDEGHRMKNSNSKFAQTLGTIYQSRHRILLTGTPLQNNLPELWALLNFLLPTIFSSVDTFDQWFNKPFNSFKNQNAEDIANGELNILTQEERMLIVHRLHEVLRPFVLRRVKDQVLDQLPEKIERVLRCRLSGWQRKMYHSITMKGLNPKDGAIAGGLNNTIMQLRKVCNHPYLFLKDRLLDDDLIRISGKFELLDRMLPKLKAAGHRVLLFSQMVEVIHLLQQFFEMRGFTYLCLDGSTTSEEREKNMFVFNDPNSPYFVFLLSTRAGGLGLNLATADTVIIFDSDWNPMVDAQAQDRAHRIGQKNEVRVFRLLTNSPIEEKILSRANDKLNLTGLVVEAGKFNSRGGGSIEENKEMMESFLRELTMGNKDIATTTTNPEDSYDNYDDEDCEVPDDEQLNEMMASYEGEFDVYQKMDQERAEREKIYLDKPRLMSALEIPSWLNEDCWPSKYSLLRDDMMCINISKSSKKKGRKRKAEGIYDENEEESDSDSSSVHIVAGKTMRKRKEVKYDDGMTDFQYQKFLEKQQDQLEVSQIAAPVKRKTSNPVNQALIKVLKEISSIKKPDGTLLAFYFTEKPSKTLFPDYYKLIQSPISLKEITNNLQNDQYKYFEEIEADFALMSNNARIFNTEASFVFVDCEKIREEFYLKSQKVRDTYSISSLSDNMNQIPPLPPSGSDIFNGQSFVGYLVEDSTPKPKKLKSREESSIVLNLGKSNLPETPKENPLVLSLNSIKFRKN